MGCETRGSLARTVDSGGVGGRALRKKDTRKAVGGGGRGVETYTVFSKKTYFLGFFLELGGFSFSLFSTK